MVKETAAEVFLTEVGNRDLYCPFFDKSNTLHVCCQNSGEVFRISPSGQLNLFHSSQGQLSSGCFKNDGTLFVADFAHGAILKSSGDGEQDIVVGEYEDRPLKGPNSVIISNDGTILFTDSGPIGETGLHNPVGSLFSIRNDMLIPISLGNLAYPTGVAAYGNFIYVCEQSQNRILRFYQEPEGVYHGSVFYQLSGGVGPSSIAVDSQGSLYVGIFETKSSGRSTGSVLVISDTGKYVSTITTDAPEVSGLAINLSNNSLYITERSSGSIYRLPL